MRKKFISYLILISLIILAIIYILPEKDNGKKELVELSSISILKNGTKTSVVGHYADLQDIKAGERTSKEFKEQLEKIFDKHNGTNGNDKINYVIIKFDNGKMFHSIDPNMLTEGLYDYENNNLERIDEVYLYNNNRYENIETHTLSDVFKN